MHYNKILITRDALKEVAERTAAPDRKPAVADARPLILEERAAMNEPFDLVRSVRLTEKATLLSEKENKYVFEVSPRANKLPDQSRRSSN